ncbi:MAG: hypothetical protein HN348_27850, partial [Proteobacteria bacterium]|nr:hypothetical protein [Pseudomonadota bacterium]
MFMAGSPAEVRQHMEQTLVKIHSVWFPRPEDVEAWRASESPLYLRRIDNNRFELGPRVDSINAARLCPVARATLVDERDGRTRLDWRMRYTGATEILLGFWVVMLLVWALVLARLAVDGMEVEVQMVCWALLAVSAASAPTVGKWLGGPLLLAGLDWLIEQSHKRAEEPMKVAQEVIHQWHSNVSLMPIESGLINQSFLVLPSTPEQQETPIGVLQQLNTNIFVAEVHHDIEVVTKRLLERGIPSPQLIPTANSLLWHTDSVGRVWRLLSYEGNTTLEKLENVDQARSAGRLIARFHQALTDLDWQFRSVRPG